MKIINNYETTLPTFPTFPVARCMRYIYIYTHMIYEDIEHVGLYCRYIVVFMWHSYCGMHLSFWNLNFDPSEKTKDFEIKLTH